MPISVTGTSGQFSIQAPSSVTLDSPNSGSYAHNQSISISWTKSGFTQNIDLYWTTGTTFSTSNNILFNSALSSFGWNIPSSLVGTSIYIWVRKTSDSTVKDRSNSSIAITSITVTQTPSDSANISEDTPTSTTTRWKFVETFGDDANITEDTPSSSTKPWKHIIPDDANISEDTPSANTSHQWKFQEEPGDEARLSEDTPSANTSYQWKFQEEPEDDANISEDTPTSSQKLWKHIVPPDSANLSEDSLGEAQKLWKHIVPPDAVGLSEDSLGEAQKLWKHIISETIAITEEEPGDLYLSEAGDFSSFTEDFSSQVLKGLELHKFDPSGTESFGILRKSGWLKASDLNNNSILRDISLRYNSQDPITVNIYTDGDEANPVFTKIAPTQTGEELFNKSFRVGRRAKYFMVELLTGETANYDTTIASLEVKVDG